MNMRGPLLAAVLALATLATTAGARGGAVHAAAGGTLDLPAGPALMTAAAESDTALDRFLSGLSDSTDRYFGSTAAPRDTAGLDSALSYGFEHPSSRPVVRRRPSIRPDFAFNRVDGPVWAGRIKVGAPRALMGRLSAGLGWAAGPNRVLGEGRYDKAWRRRGGWWRADVRGGRTTALMDRTASDHFEERLYFSTLYALFGGGDRRRYLRHDGWAVHLEREDKWWRLSAGYRDMLESPLATTATWTLVGGEPAVLDNLPAVFGRAHEAQFEARLRWPGLPIESEIQHQTSGHAIGSDFEYRRTRAALAATLGLGSHATLVPQAVYGRHTGRDVPQAAFYLGGSGSLRSLETSALGGTGLALARLDLIGTDDLLALARLPHPAWLPLEAGAFVASGAVWGADPFGGPGSSEAGWPRRERWLSEAGLSLIYQPGLPEPTTLLRFDWAKPLGPGGRDSRLSFSFTRAIDLLRLLD